MVSQRKLMQTSIAIDRLTRDRAAARARTEHLPLAVVVRIFLSEYADGTLSIGARTGLPMSAETIPVNKAMQKKMDAVITQWRGKISA